MWAFIFGIVIGTLSDPFSRSILPQYPLALTLSSIPRNIGPYAADIFNPRAWSGNNEEVTNVITLEFTRIVLAIGVFAIGVELPKAYMAKHWKSLFYLLVPVMTWVSGLRYQDSVLALLRPRFRIHACTGCVP